MAKDTFNLNEWVGNKERRLLKENYNSYNEDQEEHGDKDEASIEDLTPVSQELDEEFSEFKTYDDIIGGLIIRANAMETYLQEKEPNLVYLAKALKTIINTLNEKIEGYKLTK